MALNIVFGIKKAERSVNIQKYPDNAVATIEAEKGAGKSRRILFNKSSMELLGLEEGVTQEILISFVDQDENGNRRLLIVNGTGMEGVADNNPYTTSKNRIAFEDSKEKGKGISSKVLVNAITEFLEVDKSIQHEYEIVPFGDEVSNAGDLEIFELIKYGADKSPNLNDDIADITYQDSTDNYDGASNPTLDEGIDVNVADEVGAPFDEKVEAVTFGSASETQGHCASHSEESDNQEFEEEEF